MKVYPFSRLVARFVKFSSACVIVAVVCCATAVAQTPAPVLLSEGTGTTTRAVAFESVSHAPEPFTVNSNIAWSPDTRTRVTLFAMNLSFLPGEGANAVTADAEDGTKRVFPLTVEHVDLVPGQNWLYSVVVRLNDGMTDNLGDVLVRVSLHGVSSNRVRLGIGQVGGGQTDQAAGLTPSPAPATPPPPATPLTPGTYGPGETSVADTVRFLEQASWGPTNPEVTRVRNMGLRAYLNEQFSAPTLNPAKGSDYADLTFPLDDNNAQCPTGSPQECTRDNYTIYPIQRAFFTNALTSQDQLRQRVAWALHQTLVVSGTEINRPSWMTPYLQSLDRNAFGNYRTLLNEVTLNPGMGEYLDMRLSTRTSQNENFAREILQLFSIGVNGLNLDGTPQLDAQGKPLPAYDQNTVVNFTKVFTGWTFSTAIGNGITNYRDPMVPRAVTNHDQTAKTLLSGLVTATNQTTQADLNTALDNIFNHPNVGPFISKQLIQHLVTSNPSPAYVQRVASVFNNDCSGLYPDNCTSVRGNLKAVITAILLDPEARGDVKSDPNFGKLREPVQLINNVLRAFNAKSFDKTTTSDGVLASRSTTDFPSSLAQPVYLPNTVFSYYTPGYYIPGTPLLGPAFEILTTSTTLKRANFVNSIVYTGVTASTGGVTDRPRGTALDLTDATMNLEGMANNPAQLVDTLNTLLLHGTMTAAVRTSIINAVSSIPTTDGSFAHKRAQSAAYLVATSPQYDVQR